MEQCSILAARCFLSAICLIVPCTLSGWAVSSDSFLDAPIDTFEPHAGSELHELCDMLNRPCGQEFVLDHKTSQAQDSSLRLKKTTPRGILDAIAKRRPGYHWVIQDGVIVFEPDRRTGKDMLARKVGYVSIQGKSSYRAALAVFAQAKISLSMRMVFRPVYRYARIDLELHNATVREALNAIAKADGQVLWTFFPEDPEKLRGTFSLVSWRMSGITTFDEEVESCPTITRWRIYLRRKWEIGPQVDMASCQEKPAY